MNILGMNFDERSNCLSILTIMPLSEYRKIAYKPFDEGGNLEGQRDVIRRSSVAAKIRKRMNDDFLKGAIFPQVVLGVLLKEDTFKQLKLEKEDFTPEEYEKNSISIIDGMQRSYIYFSNYQGNEDKLIRVEFWVSFKITKLLYRMLVLNTGQVPWNTRRQIEVIYSGLSGEIINRIKEKHSDISDKIHIFTIDDARRRAQAGNYQKSTMIELYLGFNTRKVKVDVNDELADEFQRFDMMESIEKERNFDFFVDVFALLCKLDFALSNCTPDPEVSNGQFKEGKDIFTSVPACLGFVVACAEYIMGKIPVERDDDKKTEKLEKLNCQMDKVIQKVENEQQNDKFLELEVLNDIIEKLPRTKIGDEMRIYFKQVFTELLKYDDIDEIPSLDVFWRS